MILEKKKSMREGSHPLFHAFFSLRVFFFFHSLQSFLFFGKDTNLAIWEGFSRPSLVIFCFVGFPGSNRIYSLLNWIRTHSTYNIVFLMILAQIIKIKTKIWIHIFLNFFKKNHWRNINNRIKKSFINKTRRW